LEGGAGEDHHTGVIRRGVYVELISNRWLSLKRKAQTERNPEMLVAILHEIDDLLADLEQRIAVQDEKLCLTSDAASRTDRGDSVRDLSQDNSGIRSQ
jgi:hypothetical protein